MGEGVRTGERRGDIMLRVGSMFLLRWRSVS
jgi:hypothetical protein